MKKIKEPQLKVIKFKAMDVIATSGSQEAKGVTINALSVANDNTSVLW